MTTPADAVKSVRVLYFAALADELGREEIVELPDTIATASQLRRWLTERSAAGQLLAQEQIQMAVNQEIVRTCHIIRHGDEIAFFPPVTGG